jgi:type III pantothenate kinase
VKLVIDLGNTFQKLAVFCSGDMVFMNAPEKITTKLLFAVFDRYAIRSAIISSVIHHEKEMESFIKSRCFCLVLDNNTLIPLINKYDSPETLGRDRLSAAVAGSHIYPDQDVLVIDAGTCIKYDFVNAQGEYLGGAISPGLKMRFNALHSFTDKLPLVELTGNDILIGKNTTESLLSGVINGTSAEVDGIIDRYRKIYPEIQVVLSGGDAEYLVSKLKNKIFAVSNIVLNGLKLILDYNDTHKAL